MGKMIDLTGQRFGRLIVIGPANDHIGPSGKKQKMWHCICDCGNEKDILGASLRNEFTKSCGCLSSEIHSHLHDDLRKKDDSGNVIEKRCARCKQFKDISNFHKDSHSIDGLHYICKDCESYSVEGRYNVYRKNARSRNILFSLSRKEFETITSKPCFYCGEYSNEYLGSKYSGVDRINSSIGYILENVVPCCSMCNKMKMDYKVDQWFEKMKKIIQYSGDAIHKLNNNTKLIIKEK